MWYGNGDRCVPAFDGRPARRAYLPEYRHYGYMMLPTHALWGLALAAPVASYAPEFAPAVLLAGLVGGIFPDLDMYRGHRRGLHYPVLYPVAGLLVGGVALAWPTPWTVAVAVGLLAAALHCAMDVLGGGLELRPWEGTSQRAVYDHVRGRWLRPRRVVAYDGSPGDLLLAVGAAGPLLAFVDGVFAAVVVVALAIATAYVLLRRRLADLAPAVFGRVPDPLVEHVPDRYRPE